MGPVDSRADRVQLHPRSRQPHRPGKAIATTDTVPRKKITVPARVATSARLINLRLPQVWPWRTVWTTLFNRVSDRPPALAA